MVQTVVVVFGTRPEAIKLFPVVHALAADPGFRVVTCVTAQHRGLLDQVLAIAGIVPDHDLDVMRPDQSLDSLTATLLTRIGQVLDHEQPDWVVVQGDTASAMAGAMAAYYRRVPVLHVEAGLRSYDLYQPWPEEGNRKLIGALARLHCAPTETAAAALRAENVPAAQIVMTGNTVIDALHAVSARIAADPALASGLDAVASRFAGRRLIGVTTHRRENFGGGLDRVAEALATLAARDDVALIFPVHPNPHVRRVFEPRLAHLPNVALLDPLDYPHFVRLLGMVTLMLTDSGGVQEEAPALGKPVLVLRDTTERPEGVTAGTARLVGTDPARIVAETTRLLDDAAAYAVMARAHNPFGDGHASARIIAALRGERAIAAAA